MFVKTETILDKILAHKVMEVADAKTRVSVAEVRRRAETEPPARDFVAALHRDTVALIAEVKKASPSKGVLIADFDAVQLATTYAQNGAAALSVLTDAEFFQGRLEYLTEAREVSGLPVLRKDFMIDSYQVYEARAAGADAILLIAMALEDAQIADLQALAQSLGMAALIEVHNEEELERVLQLGCHLIGVNNRDLRTFQEDLTISERLARMMPPDATFVAESAIRSTGDVRWMGNWGAHAVLVGEGLVKADDIGAQVRLFSGQRREVLA
jgi:indole-3-glycerol phosphate synthase